MERKSYVIEGERTVGITMDEDLWLQSLEQKVKGNANAVIGFVGESGPVEIEVSSLHFSN